jgi:spore germination protein YaaH
MVHLLSRRFALPVVMVVAAAVAVGAAVVVSPTAGAANDPPPKRYVTGWLPYWNTQAATTSVVNNVSVFQDASPFVFDANSTKGIALKADRDEWRQMRQALRAAGVANIPTVATDLSADQFAWIIRNRDRRAAHVRALVGLVKTYNLDGIDLDYESINFGSSSARRTVRSYYPVLLRDLDARLDRLGAITSVTVASRTSARDPNWWVFDYPALGRQADRVRIMTYDFHWSGGKPGPIAPKWWVNDVAAYAARAIAPTKVSIGMPAYGRDWFVKTVSGSCPSHARETVSRTTRQMNTFASRIGKTPRWQERATSQHFTYVRTYSSGGKKCRALRSVWFDDARSLEAKVPLVEKHGLRGIAIWALGNEGAGSWPSLTEFGRTLAKR